MKHTMAGKVVYQIYPRSFADTSGDGIGDLRGIIDKLDYIADLGVDAIWLSPFYVSPMRDFGYDVSDYKNVDPLFGSMDDFTQLLAQAHARGIGVMIDFVPNHTSDRHQWFMQSRSSRSNKYRDWYVWRDGTAAGPPNNWLSNFGGSAWRHDAKSKQYYLHSFLSEQPDLNWANPDVRQAMKKVLTFWLEKGVDGFRLDAVYWMSKDARLRDDPERTDIQPTMSEYDSLVHTYSRNGPELFTYLKELVEVVEAFGGFVVSEAYPDGAIKQPVADYVEFYQKIDKPNFAPFNFEGIKLPWSALDFKSYFDMYQAALGSKYLPAYAFSNHDSYRIATRVGEEAARVLAVLLLTLPGVSFIYYGDELGLENAKILPHEVQDPLEHRLPGRGLGRDPARAPMRWDAGRFAGFSFARPWLPFGNKRRQKNVKAELKDPQSMLHLYKNLIRLRREIPALHQGSYRPVQMSHQDIYAFVRSYQHQHAVVLLNFSDTKTIPIAVRGQLLLSSVKNPPKKSLAPLEARIIQL